MRTKHKINPSYLPVLSLLLCILTLNIYQPTAAINTQSEIGRLPYDTQWTSNTGFGSGATEFSGLTLNRSNNRFVMIDDGTTSTPSRLYEFAINTDDQPVSPPLSTRDINVDLGFPNAIDIEGVAWLYGNTYAVLSENSKKIYLVDLDDPSNSPNITNAFHTIDTGISNTGNTGAQGVAYKFGSASVVNPTTAIFYVVEENPTAIHQVDWNGATGNVLTINSAEMLDFSDIYYSEANNSLYVTSSGSKRVAQYETNASFTSITEVSSMLLPDEFNNAGGITLTGDMSHMFIASETAGFGIDALSFGIFTSPEGLIPCDTEWTTSSNFGSGSNEFSGLALNRSNNRFVMVDDGSSITPSRLYEFDTNADYQPVSPPVSTRNIDLATDIEGVAWMYDNTYAILSEDTASIYLVDLNDADNSPDITDAFHTIPTGFGISDNGTEGVAYVIGSSSAANPTTAIFYVVQEASLTQIRKVDWNGSVGSALTISGMSDLSDVYYADANDSLYIVSHVSKRVAQYETDASFTSITEISSLPLPSDFNQAEGITFTSDLSRMFIASETKDFGIDALSFGIFTCEYPVPTHIELSQNQTVSSGNGALITLTLTIVLSLLTIVVLDKKRYPHHSAYSA